MDRIESESLRGYTQTHRQQSDLISLINYGGGYVERWIYIDGYIGR
jgi:hypothetical protein